MRILTSCFGSAVLALVMGVATARLGATPSSSREDAPSVAVLHTCSWSQGDPAREGAAEMVVLLEIARLRQEAAPSGVVAVGDRRGQFAAGAEQALQMAVLQGMPVVKLAAKGQVLRAPHGLFLDGGTLTEEEAREVLSRCLRTFGGLPVTRMAANGQLPGKLRSRLDLFQKELNLAAGARVASR